MYVIFSARTGSFGFGYGRPTITTHLRYVRKTNMLCMRCGVHGVCVCGTFVLGVK